MRAHRFSSAVVVAIAAASGSLFAPAVSLAATVETIFSFDAPDGFGCSKLLRASDGNFYGLTNAASFDPFRIKAAKIYRISPAGVFEIVAALSAGTAAWPCASLMQATDGHLYGVTFVGGTSNKGTIFRLSLAGALTTLVSFSGSNGEQPAGRLIQAADGLLYGATSRGGTAGKGTVFRSTTSGELTTLHSFTGDDGNRPSGGLTAAPDGSLYGLTSGPTDAWFGTAYKVLPAGTVQHVVGFTGSNGASPQGELLLASDGHFYGVTPFGGDEAPTGDGNLFRLSTSGVLTNLYDFDVDASDCPQAPLVEGPDGLLYGFTSGRGFRIAKDGSGYTPLTSAAGGGFGFTLGYDGYFYGVGTTSRLVFRMTPAGAVTPLHRFTFPQGLYPSSLIEGIDGALYGTARRGGAAEAGTVFRSSLDGVAATITTLNPLPDVPVGQSGPNALSQLATGALFGTIDAPVGYVGQLFRIDGSTVTETKRIGNPIGLRRAIDGGIYGTASGSGSPVFRISPSGSFSIVGYPGYAVTPAVQAPGGLLYGSRLGGELYRMSPTGNVTILHEFTGDDGLDPGDVVAGVSGRIYGVTVGGGAHGRGTVFQYAGGGVTTLVSFSGGSQGSGPHELLQGADGYLYGLTDTTAFRISPVGSLKTLASFPSGQAVTLFEARNGRFYGITTNGGLANNGTIFRLSIAPRAPAVLSAQLQGTGGVVLNWSPVRGTESYNVYAGTMPGGQGVTPIATGIAATSVVIPGLADGTYYFKVGAVNADGEGPLSPEVAATIGPDSAPDSFAFAGQSLLQPGSVAMSNIVAITGINQAVSMSVSGGEYRVVGMPGWRTAPGTIGNGQNVQVRHTAALMPGGQVTTTLTVGAFSAAFTSTLAPDAAPNPFRFVDVIDAAEGALLVSNAVRITGLSGLTTIEVADGEYRIGAGAWTSTPGTVREQDLVRVRHRAAPAPNATRHTRLAVGGISDNFDSTTLP